MIIPMASSLIQPVTSSMINAITRNGVSRTGKRQESGILPFLALLLALLLYGGGHNKIYG